LGSTPFRCEKHYKKFLYIHLNLAI
jgi:hypothetical protein